MSMDLFKLGWCPVYAKVLPGGGHFGRQGECRDMPDCFETTAE